MLNQKNREALEKIDKIIQGSKLNVNMSVTIVQPI